VFAKTVNMVLPSSAELRSQLLKLVDDQNVHTLSEVKDAIAKRFEITGDDRKKLSKNHRLVFDTRIIHSLSKLRKDGLITNQKKAKFKITRLGINESKKV
jgi:restriction endonuclease Mrr